MPINIFESYLSENTAKIKIDDIYKYQEVSTQTIAKFNKVIKDLKDLDPKKAAYYAKLAITPDPVKINGPQAGFRTYKKVLDDIANYKQNIDDIQEMPFKGRETIASYSLDDSSLWDIKLQKYTKSSSKIPENPFKQLPGGSAWFPVTNVTLNYNKIENKEFNLPNNLKMVIPKFKSEVPTLNITCFDNQESIVRKYFIDYMNAIYDDQRRILPYKEACSELTLYIYTSDKKIKFKKIFYVIPQYDLTIAGAKSPAVTEFTIPFIVYGESSDSLEYVTTKPYKPSL